MIGRKTDYFGTFLDTLNSTAGQSRTVPEPQSGLGGFSAARPRTSGTGLPIDALVKVWPEQPDAALSVLEVADTFGASLEEAASALKSLETLGLASNERGRFTLTETGRQAALRK